MTWFWIVWAIILIFGLVVIRGAPYVPSRKRYIDRAFTELYKLGKNDVLVDIGSGDGIVLRRASARGATAVGYEINPILVIISRILSAGSKNTTTILADARLAKFPDNTTVVYSFTASLYLRKLEQKLQKESTRLGRPLKLILYGNRLYGRKSDKKSEGYSLYTFLPLQTAEA
jgi:ubiquinone/menaquinone biosynthesis C-methylase UbiE